jgi:UDP-N-acetylmuramate--alanine ligase
MATAATFSPKFRVTSPAVRADSTTWRSAHLVGVCGSGMKALAELLTEMGWTISGSDNHATQAVVSALSRQGLRIHAGHHGRFLPDTTDVLIYSPAVSPENAERQRATRLGIPQLSYSQMLGALMHGHDGVCIAGTHGKSTTTAMTGCILTAAGLAAAVVVGAEVREIGVNGWSSRGNCFVVESCEFQKSFLDLSPRHAAILGIEPDHFDCYPHFDEAVAAFAEFVQRVPRDGRLIVHAACEASKAACVAAGATVETFRVESTGAQSPADWYAADLRPTAEGTRFRVFRRGDFLTEVSLRIPGLHNVANALAATALADAAGARPAIIREALSDFAGIRRRFEPVGSWRGATIIDDYAHHPTAVAATLATAREQYSRRRLWCVFQPHQVSRTEALFSEFAASLAAADCVLVVPVFAAREQLADEPSLVSRRLAGRIADLGGNARFVDALDRAVATLEDELEPGDVLITMGAGDIGKVHHALTRSVQGHHAPRRAIGSLHLAEDGGRRAVSHHPPDAR